MIVWLSRYTFLLYFTTSIQFSSVQSLSHVWLLVTPWAAAHQASLLITNSRSLLKLMSIELVMPSNHFILCHPILLLPSIFPSIRVFFNESALCIRWPKYWSFGISGWGIVVQLLSCFSLWPHELQYTRLHCPSPSPGACSTSCPLSWWCHPIISFSVIPFFSCLGSFPASGSFPVSWLFTSGGQSIEAQHQSFQ